MRSMISSTPTAREAPFTALVDIANKNILWLGLACMSSLY